MYLFTIILVVTVIAIAAAAYYWRRAQRMMEQAKARAEWLRKELERTDSQIEVVELWSDEQLERNDCELGNTIFEQVGRDLSADESLEGKRLCDFLSKVLPTNANSDLRTPRDIGRAWFACLQILDKEPASELAQLFKVLNDAWTGTREGEAQT
jgi:hypothetical protein